MQSQPYVYYNLDSALNNKERVKILIYNLNFDSINSIPESIEELENLEELIFLPNFAFKTNGGKIINEIFRDTLEDGSVVEKVWPQLVPNERILKLPDEIKNLQNLKRLILSENTLKNLPNTISELSNIEELSLDWTQLNIDKELPKLLTHKALKKLSIVGCEVSKNSLITIQRNWPNIQLISDTNDISIDGDQETWFEFQLHDIFISFPKNEKMSLYFYESMPKEYKDRLSLKE